VARVEAHVFIAFLAYCLRVTLARRLHALAPGLTPRSVLEKFAAVQMIDVHLPTTDGRKLQVVTAISITRICPGGIGSTPRMNQSFGSLLRSRHQARHSAVLCGIPG
jgi:hypothetical protein